MTTHVRAQVLVPAAIERVFDLAAARTDELSRFFTGHKPLIPSIRSARLLDHPDPPREGDLREVLLGDGSRIVERVLAFDPPTLHRYEMAEMNGLQRLLCSNMVSEWRFSQEGEATRIVWDYTIHEHGVMGWLLSGLVAKSFQRGMQTCLDNIERSFTAR